MMKRSLMLAVFCLFLLSDPVSAQIDRVTFVDPPVAIPLPYALGDYYPDDFDGDGKIDLAGVIIDDRRSPGQSYQAVGVWRNASTTNTIRFDTPREYGGRTETGIQALWTADLNSDGKTDLLILGHPGDMAVFINRSVPGTLRFEMQVIDALSGSFAALYDLEIADMNGDGKPDIVASYDVAPDGGASERRFIVSRNVGENNTITFAPLLLHFDRETYKFSVGDLDNDNLPDLVTHDEFDSVLFIRGNRSTQEEIQFTDSGSLILDGGVEYTRASDLNGDNRVDLISIGDGMLTILRNESSSNRFSFSDPNVLSEDHLFINRIIPGMVMDMDNDSLPDLAAVEGNILLVAENLSDGNTIRFSERLGRFYFGIMPRKIRTADISGDNRSDVVLIKQPEEGDDGAIVLVVRDSEGM